MRKFLILLVLLGVIFLFRSVSLLGAVSADAHEQIFRVGAGQGVNAVGRTLKSAGLVKSSLAFDILVRAMHAEAKIHAGTYSLTPDQNVLQVITVLTSGKFATGGTVTLIEGWDLKEYRTYLSKQGFSADAFDSLTKNAELWNGNYDFLKPIGKATLEGYLFPDTYAVDTDRDTKQLLQKMLRNFDSKMSQDMREAIAKQKSTIEEVVILASIIEKEVSQTKDRKIVADIFLKRLKDNIALQSDATVNYITDSGRTKSTAKDLLIDSPYNTYKYRGLPPGPIGNPSLDALKAVIYPESNPYYYFLTDSAGTVHYAKTFAEHQKNKERYL